MQRPRGEARGSSLWREGKGKRPSEEGERAGVDHVNHESKVGPLREALGSHGRVLSRGGTGSDGNLRVFSVSAVWERHCSRQEGRQDWLWVHPRYSGTRVGVGEGEGLCCVYRGR